LKNENKVLPIKKTNSMRLIGPLADSKENMPGTWSVAADFSNQFQFLQGVQE
jgi:beta-glucosidase